MDIFLFMHFLHSFNERASADRTKRISERRNHFKLFHSSTSSCVVLCWAWFWIFFSLWFLKVHFFLFSFFVTHSQLFFLYLRWLFMLQVIFFRSHSSSLHNASYSRIYARLCSISEWNRIEKKYCDDDGGKKTTATKVIVSHPFFPFGFILVQGHLQGKEGVWELLINQSGSTRRRSDGEERNLEMLMRKLTIVARSTHAMHGDHVERIKI